MFRRVYYLIGTYLFSLVTISCVRDVILDAGDEPQVVVECILSDEPVQTLYLVYTKSASRTEAPELKEAVAVLTDLTEEKEAGRFQRTPDGSWQLEYAAVPAHNYRLEVSVPGHELIWAEQAMPETTGIEVGWHSWDMVNGDNNVGYIFQFRAPKSPIWFYGINYPTMDSPGEQTEYLFTDSEMVDPFNEEVNTSFYEGPYLWGANSSGFRITSYPDLRSAPRHKLFLRFPASENTMDKSFYVSGSFQGYISDHKNFMHAELHPAELHYFSASEDYDLFLKDSYHLINLKTSTDLADIFIRDNVYSNIHGAIGLFGAKIERVLEWEGRDTWQKSGYFVLPGFLSGSLLAGQYLNEALCQGRPFELFHYEYHILSKDNGDYHDLLPDWSPELLPGYDPMENALSRFYFVVIQDQEQLEACGLGDCGDIDFSKKKVLVCVISFINRIPMLIGYGRNRSWPEGTYAPIILCTGISIFESYEAFFRCALLIDKDDQIAYHLRFYNSFVYSYSGGRLIDPENLTEKDMQDLLSHMNMVESLAWNCP